jgi:hypothetical protein
LRGLQIAYLCEKLTKVKDMDVAEQSLLVRVLVA